MNAMFKDELTRVVEQAFSQGSMFNPLWVREEYDKYPKRDFIFDPFDKAVVVAIRKALSDGKGWSAVRIVDAEISLLAYSAYPDTPIINHFLADSAMARTGQIRKQDQLCYTILSDLMMYSVIHADMVGVAGTWRAVPHYPEDYIPTFWDIPMRITTIRYVDFMLHLASKGELRDKIVAPNHFYFSVIGHLDMLFESVDTVFILTDRQTVTEKLCRKYGNVKFIYVDVNAGKSAGSETDNLDFLMSVHTSLPSDMKGTLSLVGAGIWAEIYCTWIKNRGGVAVDIGSGMDLMDGHISGRPVHRRLGADRMRQYIL